MQVRIHLMLRNSLMVVFLHSRSNGERGGGGGSAGVALRIIHIPGDWDGSGAGAVRMISKEVIYLVNILGEEQR